MSDILGKGTFGQVRLGTDDGEPVAIKSIPISLAQSAVREIACLHYLNFPHILTLYKIILSNDFIELYLPLANGSLTDLINSNKPIDVRRLGLQLVRAVAYCHSQDILHRDIKPQNILYFESSPGIYTLKLADFGISRTTACSVVGALTNPVYSLWYRPPEVLEGLPYGARADVWALGCVLVEMMFREPLFPAKNESDLLQLIFDTFGSPIPDGEPVRLVWPEYFIADPRLRSNPVSARLIRPIGMYAPSEEIFQTFSPEIRNMLFYIFTYDPVKRISANQLMEFPYFIGVRDVPAIPCIKRNTNQLMKIPSPPTTEPNPFGWIQYLAIQHRMSSKILYVGFYYFSIWEKAGLPIPVADAGAIALKLSAQLNGRDAIKIANYNPSQLAELEFILIEHLGANLIIITADDLITKIGEDKGIATAVPRAILSSMYVRGLIYEIDPMTIALACFHLAGWNSDPNVGIEKLVESFNSEP